jgi:predicted glycoside hydrolase/deacetylase ChbG (UPF0249 family)
VSTRDLIVNADDFGHSDQTNDGIIRAHEHGIVTSTSLMVRRSGARAAARYARATPSFSVGLHVDLGQWEYYDREADEVRVDEQAPLGEEVSAQLELFRDLVGGDPTHIDSHHHVHRDEPTSTVVRELGARLGVPVRWQGPICYIGDYYGQGPRGVPLPDAISVTALVEIIHRLGSGVSELGCHPGLDVALESSYRLERLREVDVLCDPRVRRALEVAEVSLRGF